MSNSTMATKMNSKTHKIITAFYYPAERHFVVPIDWDIKDIENKNEWISYKGEGKDIPVYEMEGDTKYPESIKDADWEDVAGYFSCCESDEEEEEEEQDERYCDNDDCPYGGFCCFEVLEEHKGKPYICEGCSTGIGLQEQEEETGCVKCCSCDEAEATHKVFRDALGEYEHTCDKCFKKEY